MKVGNINTDYNSDKYNNSDITKAKAKGSFFADELSKAEMRHIIDNRMEFLAEKIKDGDTEISYQIGASSFTEREWNKIIEKYDDIQEKLKEMMAEEKEKKEVEEIAKDK